MRHFFQFPELIYILFILLIQYFSNSPNLIDIMEHYTLPEVRSGEITIVLGSNIQELTLHACVTAKILADKKFAVQLVNAGMMSRRSLSCP